MARAPDRAVLFIDGNNWYHAMSEIGLRNRFALDYVKVSQKLVGSARKWVGTRYYIGRMQQHQNQRSYADQRRFLSRLTKSDSRISSHLGRLENRVVKNPLADVLEQYLLKLQTQQIRIDKEVFHDLLRIAQQSRRTSVLVEKAVDVMMAVDLVMMAQNDAYDAAYILSSDGDFTPVAEAVRGLGKKVYAVSPLPCAQLAQKVDSVIRVPLEWFSDCY